MNTAHATERAIINIALLHAPYKVDSEVLRHYIAPLGDADKAELRAFLTTVTIPLMRFMSPEEAAQLYFTDNMTLVDAANAFNEAFDGKYQISMTHVMDRPRPDPKHLMKVMEETATLLAA
ncbi:MAG: hypothetical protein GC134_05390 [Proteobacteria bacterium]|nr:hypothetical protein [Pseudomonadota bacterium]